MKVQTQYKPGFMTAMALVATTLVLSIGWGTAFAATDHKAPKDIELKLEPIPQTDDETVKGQIERMSAVNKALEQALDERAKSQSAFEQNRDRLASRPESSDLLELKSSETRGRLSRDNREDQRREKRLNWLND